MPIKLTVSQPAPVSLSYVEAAIKPEVTGHVTPTYEQQTVYPAAGTVFGSVEVDPIPDPTAVKEIDSNGDHDVRRYGTARVDVQPKLQHREATPNRQTQNIEAEAGFDGLSGVTVNPIPVQYIIPEGSLNITQNGDGIDVADKASVNVQVEPPLESRQVTPTKATQVITPSANYYGMDEVQVNPIPSQYIEPTGTVPIAVNGLVDVSQYANANVQVPQGVFPTGTKQITQNGTGIDVTNYAAVDVAVPVPSMPEEYCIGGSLVAKTLTGYHFGAGCTALINSLFYGCSRLVNADMPDSITSIGTYSFRECSSLVIQTLPSSLTTLGIWAFQGCSSIPRMTIPAGVTSIPSTCFSGCSSMTSVTFLGKITQIDGGGFRYCTACMLYDFSNNTAVPSLAAVTALEHANGCVIRVPQSLLTQWQNATNWNALTGVVWEGV